MKAAALRLYSAWRVMLEKLAIAILTDSRFMLARAEIFGVAPRRSVWSLKRSLILATVD